MHGCIHLDTHLSTWPKLPKNHLSPGFSTWQRDVQLLGHTATSSFIKLLQKYSSRSLAADQLVAVGWGCVRLKQLGILSHMQVLHGWGVWSICAQLASGLFVAPTSNTRRAELVGSQPSISTSSWVFRRLLASCSPAAVHSETHP